MKNRILVAKVKKKTYNTKKTRTNQKLNSFLARPGGLRKGSHRKGSHMSVESGGSQASNYGTLKTSASLFDKALNGMSSKSSYYIFLISQKPLNAVDEEYFAIDHEVMEKTELQESIDFNRVLFYTYKSLGDSSKPKKILPVENICSVQVFIFKKEYHLKIKLENGKYYFFMFQLAVDALLWLNGLRRAIRIQEELTRSKFGVLKYNIEMIYKLKEQEKNKDVDDLLDGMTDDLNPDLPADSFIEKFEYSKREINYFCDAFYSHKPFVFSVFMVLIKYIHTKVRDLLRDFWNRSYLEMTAGQILSFGKSVYEYSEMLKTWGVLDKNLMLSNKPIIVTFCNRLFDSSKEILFNVIDEAMYKFQIENKMYKNKSIKILESHINICFDNYLQFPTLETAYQLIDMIMMIITIVQMNLITQVQNPSKNLDCEVLASLLNNDFESLIHKFMKKIHKKTKSEISLQDIRRIINYPYLQRNNIKMSQVCLVALNNRLALEVDDLFHSQHQPFHKFKMQRLLDKINFQFSRIFLGLCNDYEKFDILDKMCLRILNLYFNYFLRFCKDINHDRLGLLIKKIVNDRQIMLNYFRPFIDNYLDCHIDILMVLKRLLEAVHYDDIKINILQLIAFFGDEYGASQHIRNLVCSKIYLSGNQTKILMDDFEKIHKQYLEDRNKIPKLVLFIKKMNPLALKFIKIMKKRIKNKTNNTIKMRSSLVDFRPRNTDILFENFSIDEIYNFSCKCLMIKFPVEIDDFEIEDHLSNYIKKKSR
jgi:hypothetical protein